MADAHTVENAFFACKPPEQSNLSKAIARTPLQQYIRKLCFVDLDLRPHSAERVLRQLRRLPYPESEDYVVRTLCKVVMEKFFAIEVVASVISGLSSYPPNIGVKTVDAIVEEIVWGLETNNFRLQQRRAIQPLAQPLPLPRSSLLSSLFVVPSVACVLPINSAHCSVELLCCVRQAGCDRSFPWGAVQLHAGQLAGRL